MILLTGADGYLGWPAFLKLGKAFPEEQIIGVDNFSRRQWVDTVGSVSAIPVETMEKRMEAVKRLGLHHLHFIEGDLADQDFVYQLLQQFKPDTIIHLAAQPSAPYSHINGKTAAFTQENNNSMLRNLLWGMHEIGLEDTHLIVTTTTGVYGTPEFTIPEGFLTLQGDNGLERIPYPGMATSWYHMSRANDINNLYVAHHLWKLPITDIRTSIIFGTDTEETKQDEALANRFDFDFYFGVVPNRFCAQALANVPITIYGKGEQKKPMIPLEDAVISIVNAVKLNKAKAFEVFNQASLLVSPVDLGQAVQKACSDRGLSVQLSHIPNPRVEKEEHQMKMELSGFSKQLLKKEPQSLQETIDQTIKTLAPYKETIKNYQHAMLNH
ncbi:NAD-dependent dehydratase [Pullulanibacillus camelliae]|uniref:NAD-dependent dehydratase n=1 Tax=Pullulanibacillus camelliae TaxID=1707096 RepID=A0A8J2VUI7_9BACL|nr:NAD-dependent epimerase/dehydratase family protein [Pullulanibacillus camelliae]GGE41608.1 NAD-dependent dehydratase [Pullulanibacillus camelliae]